MIWCDVIWAKRKRKGTQTESKKGGSQWQFVSWRAPSCCSQVLTRKDEKNSPQVYSSIHVAMLPRIHQPGALPALVCTTAVVSGTVRPYRVPGIIEEKGKNYYDYKYDAFYVLFSFRPCTSILIHSSTKSRAALYQVMSKSVPYGFVRWWISYHERSNRVDREVYSSNTDSKSSSTARTVERYHI